MKRTDVRCNFSGRAGKNPFLVGAHMLVPRAIRPEHVAEALQYRNRSPFVHRQDMHE